MAALLSKLIGFVPEDKRDMAMAVGGMTALATGQKLTGLALFGQALWNLEKGWRARNPEFRGGFAERWQRATDFYEATHQDPTNRMLHMVGIPLIVGGAVGLLAAPRYSPPWFLAAGTFAGGWALNIVGHVRYEKKAPAFADDPLSFVAGPVWDLQQLGGKLTRVRLRARRAAA